MLTGGTVSEQLIVLSLFKLHNAIINWSLSYWITVLNSH